MRIIDLFPFIIQYNWLQKSFVVSNLSAKKIQDELWTDNEVTEAKAFLKLEKFA